MANRYLFDSKEFEQKYTYEGELGAFCRKEGTEFLLWAPTAEKILLKFYPDCLCQKESSCVVPEKGEKGVWSYRTTKNLNGTYYCYEVTVDGITRETADPYARACGVNGNRSMVVDLKSTDPEGWEEDLAPAKPLENIIYEIHVKDFTWDVSSGVSEEKRGRFLGLCQEGTTLNGDGIHPTGIDYVKKLGVTHVQLLPVFDYGSVDEENSHNAFNWGYDPWNYNVPEGSYSSDPYHGEVRIRELKTAIQTLHRKGLRVIMDVVYNHTYQLDSFLNRTVPGYYYRFEENGSPADGSRCGNDTASEREMCARYILDSILYWAEEYHFDGFRFDLMGLMPVELMNRIQKALDQRFGPGEKMVYGEPWRAAETRLCRDTMLADKDHLRYLNSGVGAFCDSTRDAVKGSLMETDGRGFVNGGSYSKELLSSCIRGWSKIPGEYSVNAPAQTINYLSCHDDWTLWDRLINTMDENKSYEECPEDILKANRLAAALLCSCQGNLFLLSGEEFARTKKGVKNSYASSVWLNRIDWNRAWENEALMKYYQGLFELRKQLPCLCDKSDRAGQNISDVWNSGDSCGVVEVKSDGENDFWKDMRLCFNLGDDTCKVELPEGQWQLLVDGENSDLWKKANYISNCLHLAAGTAVFLGR